MRVLPVSLDSLEDYTRQINEEGNLREAKRCLLLFPSLLLVLLLHYYYLKAPLRHFSHFQWKHFYVYDTYPGVLKQKIQKQ